MKVFDNLAFQLSMLAISFKSLSKITQSGSRLY